MVTHWITASLRSTPLVRVRILVDAVVMGTGAMIAMVAAEADPAVAAVVDETGVAAAGVVLGAIKSLRLFIR